jgi:hypothetical protein
MLILGTILRERLRANSILQSAVPADHVRPEVGCRGVHEHHAPELPVRALIDHRQKVFNGLLLPCGATSERRCASALIERDQETPIGHAGWQECDHRLEPPECVVISGQLEKAMLFRAGERTLLPRIHAMSSLYNTVCLAPQFVVRSLWLSPVSAVAIWGSGAPFHSPPICCAIWRCTISGT